MKKNRYIKPITEVFSTRVEYLLAALSSTTEDNTGGGESGPSDGGTGGSSDLAKEHNYNAWSSWED